MEIEAIASKLLPEGSDVKIPSGTETRNIDFRHDWKQSAEY